MIRDFTTICALQLQIPPAKNNHGKNVFQEVKLREEKKDISKLRPGKYLRSSFFLSYVRRIAPDNKQGVITKDLNLKSSPSAVGQGTTPYLKPSPSAACHGTTPYLKSSPSAWRPDTFSRNAFSCKPILTILFSRIMSLQFQ